MPADRPAALRDRLTDALQARFKEVEHKWIEACDSARAAPNAASRARREAHAQSLQYQVQRLGSEIAMLARRDERGAA